RPTALAAAPAAVPGTLRWGLSVMAAGVLLSGLRDLYASQGLPRGGGPRGAPGASRGGGRPRTPPGTVTPPPPRARDFTTSASVLGRGRLRLALLRRLGGLLLRLRGRGLERLQAVQQRRELLLPVVAHPAVALGPHHQQAPRAVHQAQRHEPGRALLRG